MEIPQEIHNVSFYLDMNCFDTQRSYSLANLLFSYLIFKFALIYALTFHPWVSEVDSLIFEFRHIHECKKEVLV